MYIKMEEDKSLHIPAKYAIYRGENNVDQMVFLLPSQYEELPIAECVVICNYILPNGSGGYRTLNMEQELYRDSLQYSMILDAELTEMAGTVVVWLTILTSDHQTVLKTGEATVQIYTIRSLSEYPAQDSTSSSSESAATVVNLQATDASVLLTRDEYGTWVGVKVSPDEGNALTLRSNGLFVESSSEDTEAIDNRVTSLEQNLTLDDL